MREAEVWRTLKPFQPSLIRPSGSTSASAAPERRRRRARPADDHRRPLGRGERVRHRLGQLAEQLEIVAQPLDLHAEVDLGPDREHLAALARDLADAGGDQRRFPADVGADQQHHVGALDPGDGRVERDRREARARRKSGRSAALRAGSSPALRAASSPHTWSRRRAGRRRSPRPCCPAFFSCSAKMLQRLLSSSPRAACPFRAPTAGRAGCGPARRRGGASCR